ncbi:asparagine synthase (glutamine-hydrolyzing) [Paraburkholderia sp. J41]|uniref:asparagine synthase (glutamine-hydrolyzing) n=1 Tax=Paraburkholderia sp. J41 TaxID=2805433 RepID=UPI002AC341CD|nr:asparagine synthase (glutamine-hydrolyzing) [Paraburkholderia sp. J41]
MCGILGSIDIALDEQQLATLAHRGPDGSGLERHIFTEHTVYLGHRRLAIVELSDAGAQPMRAANGRFSIIFNGEVYNHLELRTRLPHVIWRGQSDTETVLEYFIHYGVESLRDLNGIFSLAIVDTQEMTLYLARDRFGVKPLYYSQTNEGLVFSSEIRAIPPPSRGRLSLENLACLLELRYVPSPATLYDNVQKLRPGHFLKIELRGKILSPIQQPFFSANFLNRFTGSFEEAIESYESILSAAVQRQLMSDVEVGIFLSGGLDSALIGSFASQASSNCLKAFTVGFREGGAVDEILAAKISADQLGLEHRPVTIGQDEFDNSIFTILETVEEPIATTSIIPMYYLAKAASKEVAVTLSGQGADEQLGGYNRYRGSILDPVFPKIAARLGRSAFTFLGISNETLLRTMETYASPTQLDKVRAIHAVFNRREISAILKHTANPSGELLSYHLDALANRNSTLTETLMRLDMKTSLADDLLMYTDKITMAHSIECRVPMLDNDLVDFIDSLPSKFKLGFTKSKIVHKALAQRRLPREIVERKKLGFESPIHKWIFSNSLISERLLDSGNPLHSIIPKTTIERVISLFKRGSGYSRHIFLLISLSCWLDKIDT